jgi:hypothetical protein
VPESAGLQHKELNRALKHSRHSSPKITRNRYGRAPQTANAPSSQEFHDTNFFTGSVLEGAVQESDDMIP